MKSLIFSIVVLFAGVTLAEDPNCKVLHMAQWAGETSMRKESLPSPVNIVIIQHTVTPEANTDKDCERIVKAIRNYQRERMGFDDIAQSFLICGNGKVYEGAGWDFVGAHTKDFNNKSVGISFIGEFTYHLPNPQALAAAKGLINCGMSMSHLTTEYKLVGHRQVSKTLSPGDALQKEIESWSHWTDSVA